jgi:hypothetical protein
MQGRRLPMLKDVFFGFLVAIALILLIIDGWPQLAGTPVEESVLCEGGQDKEQ